MMTEFFSILTSLGDKLQGVNIENEGFQDYYQYFKETHICYQIFGIGMLIAVVSVIVYYFVICNKSYALAKPYVWAVVLLLVFGGTFAYSYSTIVGHDDDNNPENATAVFKYAYDVETKLLDGTEDPDARDEISSTALGFRDRFKTSDDSILMEEELPMEMSVVNGLLSALAFFVVSMLITRIKAIRKLSIHGAGVPF